MDQLFKSKIKKSNHNPTITVGWQRLKEIHNFSDSAEVTLAYYKFNVFKVTKSKHISCITTIPRFHSRSVMPKHLLFSHLNLLVKLYLFTLFFIYIADFTFKFCKLFVLQCVR